MEEETEPTKIEKLKDHVRRHKVVYSCVVTGVTVAGITFVIMRSNSSFGDRLYGQGGGKDVYTTNPQVKVTSRIISRSTININNGPSDAKNRTLRWIVREVGGLCREWDSQADASMATGHSEANVSKHLNYGAPLSDGLQLVRVAVGM